MRVSVEESVHRSVKRFIGQALGNFNGAQKQWPVVLEERSVSFEQRPVAVVAMVAPLTAERGTRRSIPQGNILRTTSFAVTAYVEKGSTAREATLWGTRVASLLLDAVEVGLDDPAGATAISYPLSIPIYNWDGFPVEDRDIATVQPTEIWQQAAVIDHSVQPIPDPADDTLMTVVLTLRVRYMRPGRLRAHGAAPPVAGSMPGLGVFPPTPSPGGPDPDPEPDPDPDDPEDPFAGQIPGTPYFP